MYQQVPKPIKFFQNRSKGESINVRDKISSSVASGEGGGEAGGRVPPPTAKKLPKNQKKQGKNWEKIRKRGKNEKNLGRKGKNWESSFTLPLLTERDGYATENSEP